MDMGSTEFESATIYLHFLKYHKILFKKKFQRQKMWSRYKEKSPTEWTQSSMTEFSVVFGKT